MVNKVLLLFLYLMLEQPLVSIVLPTYQRAAWFASALQSAVQQTYKNIEILVMDDGADAATRAVVNSFNDHRIKHECNATPLGILGNSLAGLRAAEGKFVAILHDDDAWQADLLEKLVAPLEHDGKLVLAFANHYIVKQAGDLDYAATQQADQYFGRDTLTAGSHQPFREIAVIDQSIPVACACVLRRTAIDWNVIPGEVGGAYDLWIAYLASRSGGAAYYLPERLAYYRVHSTSGSATRHLQNATERLFTADAMLQDPHMASITGPLKQKRHERIKGMAIALVKLHHYEAARPYLSAGLRHRIEAKMILILGLTYLPPLLSTHFVYWHSRRHTLIKFKNRLTFRALLCVLMRRNRGARDGLYAADASIFIKPLASLIAEESGPKL